MPPFGPVPANEIHLPRQRRGQLGQQELDQVYLPEKLLLRICGEMGSDSYLYSSKAYRDENSRPGEYLRDSAFLTICRRRFKVSYGFKLKSIKNKIRKTNNKGFTDFEGS